VPKGRSKVNVPKVLENSQRNCKRRRRKNSHDTKTTQAEKGINKVKFLCNKKQHGGATSNINNTPINNLCWGKKSTLLSPTSFSVLGCGKKRSYLLANRSQRTRSMSNSWWGWVHGKKVTIFLKSWKPTLTFSIVSFKHNVGQLFVCVELGSWRNSKIVCYFAELYQKLITQFFSLFWKLNPQAEKVLTRYLQKIKEKKSLNFPHGLLHFVTSKTKPTFEFWISPKLWSNFKNKRIQWEELNQR